MAYALLHHFLIRKPNEEKERLSKTAEVPTRKEELDYDSLPGVATEISRARKVLNEKLKKNNLEDKSGDKLCLKSMKLKKGSVVGIIHVVSD